MSALPIPSAESQEHSQQLSDLVQQRLSQQGGWLSFADFMHMALYTTALGYYSGGSQKFGDVKSGGGDFVTAPEISPLFGQALAKQVGQVLSCIDGGSVLEFGAGTGKLAAELLRTLAAEKAVPKQYCILEVSDHLRAIQQENLRSALPSDLFGQVVWLSDVPSNFKGVMLGNEVLDAVPAHLVVKKDGAILERGVVFDDGFKWQDKPLADAGILKFVDTAAWPDGYVTEVSPAAIGLVGSMGEALHQGAVILLDYGFPAQEYYHPQRNQGTLMCHYQHYAHTDPLINLGLQDITAHVNFTAIAEAGMAQGLEFYGYTNQAQFLMNCGLLDLLAKEYPDDVARYTPIAAAVQKLLSPSEMGDLFKVIAFTKGLDETALGEAALDQMEVLLGFADGDKSHTL